MTRSVLVAFALLAGLLAAPPALGAPAAREGTFTKHTQPATAAYPARDFYRYRPAVLAKGRQRSLVLALHGCTQSATEFAAGTRWNELADRKGFLVVYPDQKVPAGGDDQTDGSGAGCWNSGQAAITERGSGELATVAQVAIEQAAAFRVDPGRVFVTGISGGALMASTLAVVYPDVFAAVGHVANCAYACGDATGTTGYREMGRYARVVPVIDIQGSLDNVTPMPLEEESVLSWLGTNDWADDGALNLSIPRSPTTVENRGAFAPNAGGELCLREFPRNPCPGGVLGGYPVTVRTYANAAGRSVVEAWTIHGLMHNWSGGSMEGSFTDPYGPNITPSIYRFFEQHAR